MKNSNNQSMKRCKICKKAVKNCVCENDLMVVESVSYVSNNTEDFEKFVEDYKNAEIQTEFEISNILMDQMQNEESPKEDAKPLTIEDEYETFLQELNIGYSYSGGTFIVDGPKKTVYVKIDIENEHFMVFSVLNKFLEGNVFNAEAIRLHARNKLTLKSLKAAKSFTNCHTK